jgi:hypothetical protein
MPGKAAHSCCRIPQATSSTDPNDYFAEGWMDFVADAVCRNALSNGPAPTPLDCREDYLEQGKMVHDERSAHGDRFSSPKKAKGQRGGGVHVGRRAAKLFLQRFLNGQVHDPEEIFYRISCALNLEPNVVALRKSFVIRTYKLMNAAPGPGPATAARMMAVIRELLRDNDVRGFLKAW